MSVVEVVVVLAIVALLAVFVLMSLPRQRESARLAGCQKNLMQIGIALAIYDQSERHLPTVPALSGDATRRADSPLRALLEGLALPDLRDLEDSKQHADEAAGIRPRGAPRAGLHLPQRPERERAALPRADQLPGHDRRHARRAKRGLRPRTSDEHRRDRGRGWHELHRRLRRATRGDRPPQRPRREELCRRPRPARRLGLPAGRSRRLSRRCRLLVALSDWRSTLYNHALTPDAGPSCIADDGRSAFMGASSGHVDRVNVLIFDGGVRIFTPRVDPKVWRAWATTHTPATTPPSTDKPSKR